MKQVPRIPRLLLLLVVRRDRAEEMADDLEQLYALRLAGQGSARAAFAYWKDVLSICLRPGFWRIPALSPMAWTRLQATQIRYEMLVATRNMRKRTGFAVINALGLAVGLVAALFIGLYVRHETAYDRHHPHAEDTYRVVMHYIQSDRHWAPIGPPVGPALAASFPEIEDVVRFFPFESASAVGFTGQLVPVRLGGFADADYFRVFHRTILSGDSVAPLDEPGEAVISASLARSVFGRTDVAGETLPAPGHGDLTVSAVMADSPSTTHQPVDLLMSMATFYSGNESWLESARTWAAFHTYVRLRPGTGQQAFEARLPGFVDEFYAGISEGPASKSGRLTLQPVTEIHLRSDLEKEYLAGGDIRYVVTFGLVAIFVLAIAVFNFVNLATAKAGARCREIGVRKSFGAMRTQLMRQFLTESLLYAALAYVLAVLMAVLGAPVFQDLSGIQAPVSLVLQPRILGALAAAAVLTGLAAGIYPAMVVSGFRPVSALAADSAQSVRGVRLRRALVTVQFALCVALIATSVIVWSQLSYLREASLGFDREHVLRIQLSSETAGDAVTANPDTFRDRLLSVPGVVAVSQASDLPGSRYSVEGMALEGSDETHAMRVAWRSDHFYEEALGLEIVEGRGFSHKAPRDTAAWLINQSAAAVLGLQEPIGSVLTWDDYRAPIVGVVRDFNFASLHGQVEPLVIPLRPGYGGNLLVRFASADAAGVLAGARSVMEELLPGDYLEYSFVDAEIAALYRREDTLRDVVAVFAGFAILVACLGLFGLAAHSAARRTREIGIRKVLGATSGSIVRLLTREYAWQLGVACLLSIPLVWLPMSRWLDTFAYRVSLSPWFFVLAGGLALILATVTIGLQAARAAASDPVHTLRYP